MQKYAVTPKQPGFSPINNSNQKKVLSNIEICKKFIDNPTEWVYCIQQNLT